MSGPIVRTGATPEFSKNWDRIFGGKSGAKKTGGTKSAARAAKGAIEKAVQSTKKAAKKVKKAGKK